MISYINSKTRVSLPIILHCVTGPPATPPRCSIRQVSLGSHFCCQLLPVDLFILSLLRFSSVPQAELFIQPVGEAGLYAGQTQTSNSFFNFFSWEGQRPPHAHRNAQETCGSAALLLRISCACEARAFRVWPGLVVADVKTAHPKPGNMRSRARRCGAEPRRGGSGVSRTR